MTEAGECGQELPLRHPQLCVRFTPHGLVLECPGVEGTRAASREILDLLSGCDGGHSVEELASLLDLPELSAAGRLTLVRVLLRQLASAGFLASGDRAEATRSSYFRSYEDPGVHRTYVSDAVRTTRYREAIEELVEPGDTVIDLGTGTGVFAFFAARAGAGVVHAVEAGALIDGAKAVAADNQLTNVVFHRADAKTMQLDVQADVLIADWVGRFVVQERLFPAAAKLRDECLKPTGHMIPSRVVLFFAPLDDPESRSAGPEFWGQSPYGLDFSAVRELEYAQLGFETRRVLPSSLLGPPEEVYAFDALAMAPQDLHEFQSADVSFTVEREGVLNGFCAFFRSQLSPGVTLDTGPEAPPTFYRQVVFPMRPMATKAGDRVSLSVNVEQGTVSPIVTLRGCLRPGAPTEQRFSARYDRERS